MKNKINRLMPVIVLLCVMITKMSYASAVASHPILVLGTDKKFGSYIGEMLKTEGFNEFQLEPVSSKLTLNYLKQFDVVILAEDSLSKNQVAIISAYVNGGGSLIAFNPGAKFNVVFGIVKTEGSFDAGYVAIDTTNGIGKGLTPVPLQFHGEAGNYTLKTAKKIATIYKDVVKGAGSPAVVINRYGKGHAMAFLYNLPQSIVYTRQGNYKTAGKEMDGINGIRAMDMFTDGWVDTTKNTINQADEQMRLLSHGIEEMSSYSKPLPRLWYFPDSLKCLVTLTNDGEDSKEAEFVPQYAGIDTMGAKMTLYIKETDFISKEWVDKWVVKGFEMGAHFNDTHQAPNPDWKTMDSVIKDLKKKMDTKYGISKITTVTNHWFVWVGKDSNGVADFAAQAKLEVNNGMRLDNNYARYDNESTQGYFFGAMGTGQGNYTGSGLSMKFSDNDGKVVDIYQHICNVYDQQYMEHDDSIGFYNCFKGLVDRSLYDGVYSFVSVKAHNLEYFFSKIPLTKMLAYANKNGVPVWTAAKLLDFLEAKDAAGFTNIKWSAGQLTFDIRSPSPHTSNLGSMVPYQYKGKKIKSIQVNGKDATYAVENIKGSRYALFTIRPGSDYRVAVRYLP